MGQIRFDAARMQELSNRLDDIINQLAASANANNNAINTIDANINGSAVNSVLAKYKNACESVSNQARSLLLDLNGSLKTKISNYTQAEQEAADVLTDVQSILQGLE